ncbi:MAG TPA: hypothetical protein VMH06_05170 [Thermodesulfovibrionales bacterium]|nr:hypothetical protein [Thermodesulfovibrionales bacterium]
MWIAAPFVFVLTLVLSSPASALMKAFTTEELAKSSDLVISGEVEEVSSRWSGDGKTIVTRAVVVTGEVMKGGAAQARTIVEYPGGEVGAAGLRVLDVSPLRRGERVVLFLRPSSLENGGTIYAIVGKGQGKYTMDDKGVARKGGFSVLKGEGTIDYSLSLDSLREKIRKAE